MKNPETQKFSNHLPGLLKEMATDQPASMIDVNISATRLETLELLDPKREAIYRLYFTLRAYGEPAFFAKKSFVKVVLDEEVESMLNDVSLAVEIGLRGRRGISSKIGKTIKMYLHNNEDVYLGCVDCCFNVEGFILHWNIVELKAEDAPSA